MPVQMSLSHDRQASGRACSGLHKLISRGLLMATGRCQQAVLMCAAMDCCGCHCLAAALGNVHKRTGALPHSHEL